VSEAKRCWLSWSTGKDSAWALSVLRQRDDLEVVALLTTLNETVGRVAMHAVRDELLERQAAATGLPLVRIPLPHPCTNEVYEERMTAALERARADDVELMAFGDLFLEDIRAYRERQLEGTGITPVFPLFGEPTAALARTMVASGLRAWVTCVDPKQLDPSFAGRHWDGALLDDLPEGVDPCGERGELHTFAYAAPCFSEPIACQPGEVVERDGFVFADVLPA
jgi:uncharacterized protein (TIGR00290 family)